MLRQLVERLEAAGCVAADEEAAEILAAAAGGPAEVESMVARREAGEPLAWVTGSVSFCGVRVAVLPGVYVPRQQTAVLVAAAVEVTPPDGIAVDLCTGSGAVAVAIRAARPGATVLASDVDPVAWRCARANGVDAFLGDLDEPLPAGLAGTVDVVTAVAPYVPSDQLRYLPRDARDHEPRSALDGGTAGLDVLARVVPAAVRLLRPGGHLVVEVGGDQDRALAPLLTSAGMGEPERWTDEDGDLRALRLTRRPRPDRLRGRPR